MSEQEEEALPKTGSRPNQYWKEQREAAERDVFKGEYRGVRQPKPGAQAVKPEDVIGQYELCWCGETEGHEWPGKALGRRHPRKASMSASAELQPEAPRVSRVQIKHFDDEVMDIILRAVNDYGVRYRISQRGIILYPKDGSEAYTIHANAQPRSIKAARIWFVKHVADVGNVSIKEAVKKVPERTTVDTADIAELAAELNGPEHQGKAALPPVAPPVPKPPAKKAEAQSIEPEEVAADQAEPWVPMVRKKDGSPVPGFERWGNTEKVRCIQNKDDGTRCGWEGRAAAVSGHNMNHDKAHQEAMWGAKAQDKKRDTIANRMVHERVTAAIKLLHQAIGEEPQKADTKKYTAQIDELTKQVAKLKTENDDLRARIDLMREAFNNI